EVVRARADDVVVRDGRVVAVATGSGELAADVVVCAVDPRALPALAASVARPMPWSPPAMTFVGLEGEVRDLPHELVVQGDPTLFARPPGGAPDGRRPWPGR